MPGPSGVRAAGRHGDFPDSQLETATDDRGDHVYRGASGHDFTELAHFVIKLNIVALWDRPSKKPVDL